MMQRNSGPRNEVLDVLPCSKAPVVRCRRVYSRLQLQLGPAAAQGGRLAPRGCCPWQQGPPGRRLRSPHNITNKNECSRTTGGRAERKHAQAWAGGSGAGRAPRMGHSGRQRRRASGAQVVASNKLIAEVQHTKC